MRRRSLVATAASVVTLSAALLACVDLFHRTEFDTLCDVSPNDPACAGDAADESQPGTPDAAADASTPRPDFCSWSSSEARTQALRACAWLGACEGPLGESAFGPCVVRAQLAFNCVATPTLRPIGAVDAFWACLATVASCGDVDRCVFPAGVVNCNEVSGTSTACGAKSGANAGIRLECSGPKGRAVGVEPCVLLGKTCSEENPSIATCSGATGFDCTATKCSGSSAVDCNLAGLRTFDRGIDCAGYGGGACVPGAAGSFCEPGKGAGSCAGEAAPACEDAVATSCADGKLSRVNCAAIGLPCDVSQPVAPYELSAACVDRSATACTVADSCSGGTRLDSCGRGAAFSIDCAQLGLGKCRVDAAGRASCTPP